MIRRTTPVRPRYVLCASAITAAATLLAPRNGTAQVNIERLRKHLDHDGLAGTIEGALTGRTGNTEAIVAGSGAQARGQYGRHTGLLALRGDYARNGPTVQVENTFAHARYAYALIPSLWGEAFVQLQGDALRRLRFRSLAGVGPRVGLYESHDFDLFLGTAYMLEREVVNVEPGADDDPVTIAHRSSSYLSATLALDARFLLSAVVYVQPRFDRPSDARILGEGNLAIEITKSVGTKIECTVRHDSAPPTGVRPTDVTLRNALTLTF
jgi:hypothetical protein